jgi:hypothetical protein
MSPLLPLGLPLLLLPLPPPPGPPLLVPAAPPLLSPIAAPLVAPAEAVGSPLEALPDGEASMESSAPAAPPGRSESPLLVPFAHPAKAALHSNATAARHGAMVTSAP